MERRKNLEKRKRRNTLFPLLFSFFSTPHNMLISRREITAFIAAMCQKFFRIAHTFQLQHKNYIEIIYIYVFRRVINICFICFFLQIRFKGRIATLSTVRLVSTCIKNSQNNLQMYDAAAKRHIQLQIEILSQRFA